MSTINLYVLKNSCPRCDILLNECKKSPVLKNKDFSVIEIDPKDDTDPLVAMLKNKGINFLPVMEIDNTILDFSDALRYVRE